MNAGPAREPKNDDRTPIQQRMRKGEIWRRGKRASGGQRANEAIERELVSAARHRTNPMRFDTSLSTSPINPTSATAQNAAMNSAAQIWIVWP